MNTTIMLPLDAAHVASFAVKPSDGRPALACLYVDLQRKQIAAADGYRLVRLPMDANQPVFTDPTPEDARVKGLLVPAQTIIDIAKQAKGKQADMLGIMLRTENNVTATLSVQGKLGEVSTSVTLVDAIYPDIDQLVPRHDPGAAYFINPKLMADSLMAMHKAGCNTVKVSQYPNNYTPLRLDGVTPSGQTITAIVMPMPKSGHGQLGEAIAPPSRDDAYAQAAD